MALLSRVAPIGAVILVWFVAFAVVGYIKTNFTCPRCGELFFHKFDARPWRRSYQHNPFARRCMHCGLPKWADRDVGVDTRRESGEAPST